MPATQAELPPVPTYREPAKSAAEVLRRMDEILGNDPNTTFADVKALLAKAIAEAERRDASNG